MDLTNLLRGYSRALYSTWLWYRPDHLMWDCGEGAASTLGNFSFALERIFLTHGHIDHISGLPSLLWARAAGMGDNLKPLEIYYPEGDPHVEDMIGFLEKTRRRVAFELRWIPLRDGDAVPLTGTEQAAPAGMPRRGSASRNPRRMTAFATRHVPGRLTLGYHIVEERRRLQPQYARLGQNEIRELMQRDPTAQIMESYQARLVTVGGDGLPLPAAQVQGSSLLMHEATLLDAGERKHQWHSTLPEVLQVAVAAAVRALLLYHFSGRYHRDEIVQAIKAEARAAGYTGEAWLLLRDRLLPVQQTGEETS